MAKAMMKSMKKAAAKAPVMKKSMMKASAMKKSGMKKKMNQFFVLMTEAKKKDAASFVYNGKTYKKQTNEKGLIFYKK